MITILAWVHTVLCVFGFVILIGLAGSPNVTKDLFIVGLFVWLYMVLISIALIKSIYKDY
jgi:hypothetical protein